MPPGLHLATKLPARQHSHVAAEPHLLLYFLAIFLFAMVFLLPLRVRELVLVRWPRTGRPATCLLPR